MDTYIICVETPTEIYWYAPSRKETRHNAMQFHPKDVYRIIHELKELNPTYQYTAYRVK